MLERLLLWMFGYLKIKLTGLSIERFLNLCKYKNVYIWDIKSVNDHYQLFIKLNDFKKMKPFCKKTRTRVKILRRYGFPFLLHRFQKRKMFVLGVLLFFLHIFTLKQFIWEIEINGEQQITEDVLYDYLKMQNIYHGVKRNHINGATLVDNLRQDFDEIVWASVSINGTVMQIDIKEKEDTVSINGKELDETSIYADKSGVIVKMITRAGTPQVKTGDLIKEGDLLVSGIIDVKNDNGEIVSQKFVDADADIWIEYTIPYEDKVEECHLIKMKKEEFIQYQISFQNHLFTLGVAKEGLKESFSEEIPLRLNHYINTPIKLTKTRTQTYVFKDDYYTQAERISQLEHNFKLYCDGLSEQKCEIIDGKLLVSDYINQTIGRSNLLVREQIGIARKIIDLSSENMIQ